MKKGSTNIYWDRMRIENPEIYEQKRKDHIQYQIKRNAELNEVMEYNKRFPLNSKIITLKKIYITCKNKCTGPTDFKKCENCKQYLKYFDDVRKFKTENQLVYIGR